MKKSKKQIESIKMLLKTQDLKKLLMLRSIKKWWDIKQKELKVNYTELEVSIFVKCLCLVLMMKDTY